MRRLATLVLLALAVPAAAQELPRPTEAGTQALDALIERCVASGGLTRVGGANAGPMGLTPGDPAKLAETIAADRAALSAELIDALIARCGETKPVQRTALVELLKAAGEATGDNRAPAFVLYFRADQLEAAGDAPSAIPLYVEAGRRFAALGEPRWQAACTSGIGLIHHARGDLARALEYALEALEGRRAALGDLHAEVGRSYNNIARVYAAQGDHARALEYFLKGLEIRRAAFGENHADVGASYNNIAIVYRARGDHARALEYHLKALEIRRSALGENHADVGAGYNNIAIVYRAREDHARALEYHLKALEILRAALGENHAEVGRSYNNIAIVYNARGDQARALEHHLKALEILRAALGENHAEVGQSYNNIAIVYRAREDHARALENLDQAYDALLEVDADLPMGSARASLKPRPLPLTVQVLELRGQIRDESPGPDPAAALHLALRDYHAAADVLDRLRQRVIVTDESRRLHGERRSDLFPLTVGVVARLAELEGRSDGLGDAFEAAERGAARVFLDGLGRSRANVVGQVDPTLRDEEARLIGLDLALEGQIGQEQAKPLDKRDREKVGRLLAEQRAVRAELDALVERMEREFPQYAALKYPKACSIDQARACLDDDEVALSYVLGSEASYLVVLAKHNDPATGGLAVHKLPPADEVAELVAAATRPGVLEDDVSARELGARAYAMLLAPAAAAIAGKDLVVMPGGALGQLPFEMLVEPGGEGGAGRYLVEGHRVRYAPSLTALHFVGLWEATRAGRDRPLWAAGDPVYDGADPRLAAAAEPAEESTLLIARLRGSERGEPLGRLEASGVEVAQIAGLLGAGEGDVRLGPAATEAAVKAASADGTLARCRYVHFATHGVLGTAGNEQPGLVLSLVGDQAGEDGYLRLDEVTGLRLNADLVVLSACQSGLGRVGRAEGVSGLSRAFLSSGSRGVVSSLWRVDDQATADLMTALYSGLNDGKSTSASLGDAQRAMIADGEPPAHWAAFVMIGR